MRRSPTLSLLSGFPLLAGILLLAAPAAARDSLPFGARVDCQRAIEEVYWQHRIWPPENREPKPGLEEVLPFEALRARVEDYLKETDALERYWGHRVTGAELQGEIERIARSTKQPEILAELWQALGRDPFRIAECVARPALVDRLARERYARDARRPGQKKPFEVWWRIVKSRLGVDIVEPSHPYSLPAIQEAPEAGEQWSPTHALPEGNLLVTGVWTGSEMIIWGGTELGAAKYNNGARYNPVTDTWRTTSSIGAPWPRKQHTAVWTGTEMIVWGGCGPGSEHSCETSTGGRYNPATDSWNTVTGVGNPGARISHTAVWTGSEMLVWGGCAFLNDACLVSQVGSAGGRYSPSTDTWAMMTSSNAPSPRIRHTALWTGTEMVVWGGTGGGALGTGGRYNPVTDAWQSTAPAPLVSRYDHTAVWTGGEMLVWGGTTGSTALNTGGRYDPAGDSWKPMLSVNAGPSARSAHAAVWTGSEMIVWSGWTGSTFLDTGARYNPAARRWAPTSTVNAPPGRARFASVWTGSLMLVWGGDSRLGGRYDPVSDTWSPTNNVEAASAREWHTAVWTGVEMIAWGGEDRFLGTVGTGSRYVPALDTWQPTATAGAPFGRRGHTALWTGTEMIVWGGQYGPVAFGDGGRYNPMTDAWVATGMSGAPEARSYHSAVWTGAEMIVWGGGGETSPWLDNGGRYRPSTDSWTTVAMAGAPSPRYLHSAAWTGAEMIIWGGATANFDTNTGGRYNPSTNSWQATSVLNAPSPRTTHTAVWTGTEMLVWGGQHYSGVYTYYGDGARYDPSSDVWIPMSLVGAPSPRAFFGHVWTGTEMIVWAGCTTNSGGACAGAVPTGARYQAASDTWIPTTLQSAPAPRSVHTAVWTGAEMIVWGGLSKDNGTYTNTGGRYRPGTPTAPADDRHGSPVER